MSARCLFFAAVAVAVLAGTGRAALALPDQIRLHYTGDPTEMMVSWTTDTTVAIDSVVEWGETVAVSNEATGVSNMFKDWQGYVSNVHYAVMTNLKPETTYYYRVGDNTAPQWSQVFSFVTSYASTTFAVYGDFGLVNDRSLEQLMNSAAMNRYQAVLHVGDLAYDLYNDKGARGDKFLHDISSISATKPYMVMPGNHESNHNFTHYVNRFAGLAAAGSSVGNRSLSGTPLWYSFDHGPVHFIAFDTEAWLQDDPSEGARMLQWMSNDLAAANARRTAERPWIIALSHKGSWMGNTRADLWLPILTDAKVDVLFVGHQHNYQRYYPFTDRGHTVDKQPLYEYKDPKYLVQIVVGSPGNQEKISPSQVGPYEARANAIFEYGYGQVSFNSSHMLFQWFETGQTDNDVFNPPALDDLTIVKSSGRYPSEVDRLTNAELRK